jgi:hypothetical protein
MYFQGNEYLRSDFGNLFRECHMNQSINLGREHALQRLVLIFECSIVTCGSPLSLSSEACACISAT